MMSILCNGRRDVHISYDRNVSKEERARRYAAWARKEKLRKRFIAGRLAELRKEIEVVAQRVAVGDKVTYVVESYTCSCWDREDYYYHLEVTPSQFDIIQKFVMDWDSRLSVAEKIHAADLLLRSRRRAPAEINSETAEADLSFMGSGCDAISYPSCESVAEWESRQLPDLDAEPQDPDSDADADDDDDADADADYVDYVDDADDADSDAEPQAASQHSCENTVDPNAELQAASQQPCENKADSAGADPQIT